MIDVILQHGWAWDAGAWAGWGVAAGERAQVWALERGYFGRPALGWWDMEQEMRGQIVVAHSLGLHILPQACLERAKLLVILGGFQCFHPDEGPAARRSRRVVERMLERLPVEPRGLVGDFYAQCFAPNENGLEAGETINVELLERDLNQLHSGELDLEILRRVPQVMLLHGGEDRIVPLERAEHLHGQLPSSQLTVFADAGHALPFTHARACWEVVEQVWRQRGDDD